MSNSATNLPQITSGQTGKEIIANRLFDSASPSMVGARKDESCNLLTWAFRGGWDEESQTDLADGTVTLTASSTNYIVKLRASPGTVSTSTATTNWNNTGAYRRLYSAVTDATAVTSWLDRRSLGPPSGTSGGTAGSLNFDTDGTLAANSDALIATQKATKTYVDGKVASISWKQAARAASTANGTLATAFENGDTLDGVTLATGDRILLKDQSAGAENGIYTVNASGAPTRATDADSSAELVNAAILISEGTANADTQWVCSTNAPITVNTTALVFVQFSGAIVSQEAIEDYVAALIAAGTHAGVVVTYNDGVGTLSFAVVKYFSFAVGDEDTAITAGTTKVTLRLPHAFANITAVRASLKTAQATNGAGGIFTVDINIAGATILSTKITLDNTEKTSVAAATPPVISTATATDDAEVTVDVDQIGDGTATGLKCTIIGT